jgi:hypothetical protein
MLASLVRTTLDVIFFLRSRRNKQMTLDLSTVERIRRTAYTRRSRACVLLALRPVKTTRSATEIGNWRIAPELSDNRVRCRRRSFRNARIALG